MKHVNPFRILPRIHTAMLAGMVLFCVVSAAVRLPGKLATNITLNKMLQVTVLAVSFALIKTGLSLFDRKLQRIRAMATAAEKMAVYKKAAIIKWAMIEGAVLFAAVCFMITRNYAFIVLAFALIIFFALQAPSRLKIMLQLQLSQQEADTLQ